MFLVTQKIWFSKHAIERIGERGIGINAIRNALHAQPFKYFQQGVWKLGYYDSVTKVFLGMYGNTITTVINNVTPNYIRYIARDRSSSSQ